MWDLIVSVPDHCLSFYFSNLLRYSSIARPTNKKSVTNSLDMTAANITFECSFISLDICITST